MRFVNVKEKIAEKIYKVEKRYYDINQKRVYASYDDLEKDWSGDKGQIFTHSKLIRREWKKEECIPDNILFMRYVTGKKHVFSRYTLVGISDEQLLEIGVETDFTAIVEREAFLILSSYMVSSVFSFDWIKRDESPEFWETIDGIPFKHAITCKITPSGRAYIKIVDSEFKEKGREPVFEIERGRVLYHGTAVTGGESFEMFESKNEWDATWLANGLGVAKEYAMDKARMFRESGIKAIPVVVEAMAMEDLLLFDAGDRSVKGFFEGKVITDPRDVLHHVDRRKFDGVATPALTPESDYIDLAFFRAGSEFETKRYIALNDKEWSDWAGIELLPDSISKLLGSASSGFRVNEVMDKLLDVRLLPSFSGLLGHLSRLKDAGIFPVASHDEVSLFHVTLPAKIPKIFAGGLKPSLDYTRLWVAFHLGSEMEGVDLDGWASEHAGLVVEAGGDVELAFEKSLLRKARDDFPPYVFATDEEGLPEVIKDMTGGTLEGIAVVGITRKCADRYFYKGEINRPEDYTSLKPIPPSCLRVVKDWREVLVNESLSRLNMSHLNGIMNDDDAEAWAIERSHSFKSEIDELERMEKACRNECLIPRAMAKRLPPIPDFIEVMRSHAKGNTMMESHPQKYPEGYFIEAIYKMNGVLVDVLKDGGHLFKSMVVDDLYDLFDFIGQVKDGNRKLGICWSYTEGRIVAREMEKRYAMELVGTVTDPSAIDFLSTYGVAQENYMGANKEIRLMDGKSIFLETVRYVDVEDGGRGEIIIKESLQV